MPREVRWERMFLDELEAAYEACPVVYFAYGLCEPHGPQNTVGLDALKAHAICCRAAAEHGGIVAPPDYWHIHEIGGYAVWAERAVGEVNRHWMTCVPPWIHFRNVVYQIRAADAAGLHAAILLTGHYGPNWEDLKTIVNLIQPYVGARLYALPDFEANKPGFDGNGNSGDHAGRVETSLLWALEPDCVDVSRLPDKDDNAPHFAMGKNAYDADRKIGERMVADEVKWLGEKSAELLAEYARVQPKERFVTYEQVETVWEEVVRPALPDFKTLRTTWGNDGVSEG
ncbi:MAG: creatininase family protein, partial [Candidatus Poribacteria bacterium]|nr:creatininase family protein [Candidatus Poribacteria bacterium]